MKKPPEPKINIPAREQKLQFFDQTVVAGSDDEKNTEEIISVSPARAIKRLKRFEVR